MVLCIYFIRDYIDIFSIQILNENSQKLGFFPVLIKQKLAYTIKDGEICEEFISFTKFIYLACHPKDQQCNMLSSYYINIHTRRFTFGLIWRKERTKSFYNSYSNSSQYFDQQLDFFITP